MEQVARLLDERRAAARPLQALVETARRTPACRGDRGGVAAGAHADTRLRRPRAHRSAGRRRLTSRRQLAVRAGDRAGGRARGGRAGDRRPLPAASTTMRDCGPGRRTCARSATTASGPCIPPSSSRSTTPSRRRPRRVRASERDRGRARPRRRREARGAVELDGADDRRGAPAAGGRGAGARRGWTVNVGGPWFEDLAVGQEFARRPGADADGGSRRVPPGDRRRPAAPRARRAAVHARSDGREAPARAPEPRLRRRHRPVHRADPARARQPLLPRPGAAAPGVRRRHAAPRRPQVVALKQNRGRADGPGGAAHAHARPGRERAVLDFLRCPMLPLRDADAQTGHADDVSAIPAAARPGGARRRVPRGWHLGPLRRAHAGAALRRSWRRAWSSRSRRARP